jgi:hypothetical protein
MGKRPTGKAEGRRDDRLEQGLRLRLVDLSDVLARVLYHVKQLEPAWQR